MPALLDVRHLWKSFGGVHAVRDCSFDVEAGRITGLIGPNGAGKSTAIDLISGFLKPDAGVIRFAGLDVGGRPAHRVARLGLVRTFQSPRVWAGLTVMENMLLAAPEGGREEVWRAVCTPARLRESEDADRVQARAILGEFGLLPLKNDPAGNLSGGQKRLLEIARIFQARPRMVLMDEPLTGVNPVLGGRIGEGIKTLVAAGMTVLMVEHNLPFVEQVCGTVIVMALGRPIAHGPLAALRSDPAVVDAYLGQVPARV